MDDYTPPRSNVEQPKPSDVVGIVTAAAEQTGFRIDYLAREAGCAIACERRRGGCKLTSEPVDRDLCPQQRRDLLDEGP